MMDTSLMALFTALQEPWTVGVFMNSTKSIRGKEVFPVVMYGCENWTIKLSTKKLTLLNYGVGEHSQEFLRLQGDQTSLS